MYVLNTNSVWEFKELIAIEFKNLKGLDIDPNLIRVRELVGE